MSLTLMTWSRLGLVVNGILKLMENKTGSILAQSMLVFSGRASSV